MSASLATLRTAILSSATLREHGSITEYLPVYAELTYRFHAGLTARIACHGDGNYQMTFDGFLYARPATADQVVRHLASIGD